MRIIREDQNLMILKDRNIIVFVVGISFAFLGFAIIFKPDFFTQQTSAWYGLIGIFLGVFVIIGAWITTITLDKTTNKLLFSRKNLLGKKVNDYNLDQIKEIELSATYRSSRKSGGYSYHLAFILNNDEKVPFNPGSSSILKIMGRQVIPEKYIGARAASFLGVPFQERRLPTVNEVLSTVSSAIQSAAEKEMKKRKKE